MTASGDGTIRVWYAQPRELRTDFASSFSDGTPNPVFAAQYSPGGGRILVVDSSAPALMFTDSGKSGWPVLKPGEAASVYSALFNRAGTEIVTADSDGTVDLWHASGSDYTQIHLPSPIHLTTGRCTSVSAQTGRASPL